jgi:hypothetical protein
MPDEKLVHGGRELLNPPGFQSTAAIVAEVRNSKHPDNNRYYSQVALIQISDCDRKVTLDFAPGESPAQDEADLYKVDTLLRVLKDFRKGLVLEQKRRTPNV